jgi:hypothetical protein
LLSKSADLAESHKSSLLVFIESRKESFWHLYKLAISLLCDAGFQQANLLLIKLSHKVWH